MTLTPQEQAALQEFKRRLVRHFPDEITRVILFGSKARGDARPDSDIDVLVVATREDAAFRHDIQAICCDLLLEQGILLSVVVIAEQRQEHLAASGASFWDYVARDGIPI